MNPSELLNSELRLSSKFLLFDGHFFLFPESHTKVSLDRVISFAYNELPSEFQISYSRLEDELIVNVNIAAMEIFCFEEENPISIPLGVKSIERQVEAINFCLQQSKYIEKLYSSLKQKQFKDPIKFEKNLKDEIFHFMHTWGLLKSLNTMKINKRGTWNEGGFSYNIYLFRILRNAISFSEINEGVTELFDMEKISLMSGIEFENFLIRKLKELGVTEIQSTPVSGDQGADIIFTHHDKRVVVQAKRYIGKVGNKAIQEVFAAKTFYSCSSAWVITNSTFTDSAIKLAGKLRVVLIDGRKLSSLEFLLKAS
jgi:HJR/Mrr/RecB family endonuclease